MDPAIKSRFCSEGSSTACAAEEFSTAKNWNSQYCEENSKERVKISYIEKNVTVLT